MKRLLFILILVTSCNADPIIIDQEDHDPVIVGPDKVEVISKWDRVSWDTFKWE